jgi:hypothetical protein
MTEKVLLHVVKGYVAKVGIVKLAPHDLRRTCDDEPGSSLEDCR